MATQTGKVQNFQNVALILGLGHRVDAFDTAGIGLAWQGDKITVIVGPGGVAMAVDSGVSHAIITVTLMPASDSIDYIWSWVSEGDPRLCSLKDSNGRTFLTDPKAYPRQRADMTFNATANPVAFDIHCPQLSGPQGGLNT
jgi:hypothetical protein